MGSEPKPWEVGAQAIELLPSRSDAGRIKGLEVRAVCAGRRPMQTGRGNARVGRLRARARHHRSCSICAASTKSRSPQAGGRRQSQASPVAGRRKAGRTRARCSWDTAVMRRARGERCKSTHHGVQAASITGAVSRRSSGAWTETSGGDAVGRVIWCPGSPALGPHRSLARIAHYHSGSRCRNRPARGVWLGEHATGAC